MKRVVTTWYLEMQSPEQLRPAPRVDELSVARVGLPSPEFNRFFYTAVGGDLYWVDRLEWTFDDWMAWLERPGVETWAAFVDGAPAGYFELENQGGDVELVYFGLLPSFVGRGLGGDLLTRAIERAWSLGATRVWLHTCSLDAEVAMKAYLARGFVLVREESEAKEVPERSPGPWPGAGRVRDGR